MSLPPRHKLPLPSLPDIRRVVSRLTGVSERDICTKRTEAAVAARALMVLLIRDRTIIGYPEIGEFPGGKPHSSPMTSYKHAERLINTDAIVGFGVRRERFRGIVNQAQETLDRLLSARANPGERGPTDPVTAPQWGEDSAVRHRELVEQMADLLEEVAPLGDDQRLRIEALIEDADHALGRRSRLDGLYQEEAAQRWLPKAT